MNQRCKVCGEPAAGFHFGAFTCEGCKSFFGRSYNNINSIGECKNGNRCVINKKNRTACKPCRLKKCLFVGMSKSGSRYGRRSNWFKIHCLLQEQQHQQQQMEQQLQQHQQLDQQLHQQQHHYQPGILGRQQLQQLSQQQHRPSDSPLHSIQGRREENVMLTLDEYKNSNSPSISSPDSGSSNSDSSVEVSERRAAFAGHPGFRPPHLQLQSIANLSLPLNYPLSTMSLLPPGFLPPPSLAMFPPYSVFAPAHTTHGLSMATRSPITTVDENEGSTNTATWTVTTTTATMTQSGVSTTSKDFDFCEKNNNDDRFNLDVVLQSDRSSTPTKTQTTEDGSMECDSEMEIACPSPQDNPMDLSMKSSEYSDKNVKKNNTESSSTKTPIDLTKRF